MRGEFLAVTFSWEMIGPTPKFAFILSAVNETRGVKTGFRREQCKHREGWKQNVLKITIKEKKGVFLTVRGISHYLKKYTFINT